MERMGTIRAGGTDDPNSTINAGATQQSSEQTPTALIPPTQSFDQSTKKNEIIVMAAVGGKK